MKIIKEKERKETHTDLPGFQFRSQIEKKFEFGKCTDIDVTVAHSCCSNRTWLIVRLVCNMFLVDYLKRDASNRDSYRVLY